MMDYQSIFQRIAADPRYTQGLDWGEPRPGHPEGTIRAHIAALEANLESLSAKLSDSEYWKLKLLIHTHDLFKGESDHGVSILDLNSHASLARAFLSSYCTDADLLAMVQFHDEPFALYLQARSKGKYNQDRFDALLHAIDDWNVFLAFNIIDGCASGKSRKSLHWLFHEIAGKVGSKFTAADIID